MNELFYIKVDEEIESSILRPILELTSYKDILESGPIHLNLMVKIYAEMIIRYIGTSKLKIPSSEFKFARGIYGKPYISNQEEIEYNISQ